MSSSPTAKSSAPWIGRFVWHDLMTTDLARSKAFYGALMGWSLAARPMGAFTYHMIMTPAGPIGGIVEEKALPISHWMPYCAVRDVDAAAERCKKLGGSVCVPPADIPMTGRFAVCGDPQGAYFSIFAGLPESPGADPDCAAHGRVCWNALMTTDDEAAQRFYTGLFGWQPKVEDMGPMGRHRLQMNGALHAGGITRNPMPGAPAWWCMYFAVNDLAKSTNQARSLGAKVLVESQPIPNVGAFSMLQDPVGANFALFKGH